MKTVAVIMAGGRGERFWPYSRRKRPKQFLSLTPDGKPMIRLTFERICRIVPPEDVLVVTGAEFVELVQEHLPELPAQNILSEPCARNTAPCVGLAAAVARHRYKEDVVLAVMPSDHLIREEAIFLNDLQTCVKVASQSEAILTMGITPTYPETGYGYIHYGEPCEGFERVYRVFAFTEKPPLETARRYVAEGCYLWNSGIFVFRADSMLLHMARLMPALYGQLERLKPAIDTPAFEPTLAEVYAQVESVSIDYGIMEKSEDILTVPGSFGWDDVGSWNSLERVRRPDGDGNVLSGDVLTLEANGNIVMGENGRLTVLLGVKDMVVVEQQDVTFICSKNKTQDIRSVLSKLRDSGRDHML